MTLKIITPPATEPVTLAKAKVQCRVDHNDEDALISTFIQAAREQCEHLTGRAIPVQTLELVLDKFPSGDIQLPMPPAIEVSSVKYINPQGNEVTLSPSSYSADLDSEPAWVLRAVGVDFPETSHVANAVRVRYNAGYAVVPSALENWILLAVGTMYANREAYHANQASNQVPHDFYMGLLDRYKLWGY